MKELLVWDRTKLLTALISVLLDIKLVKRTLPPRVMSMSDAYGAKTLTSPGIAGIVVLGGESWPIAMYPFVAICIYCTHEISH